jgi:hypothetical protein
MVPNCVPESKDPRMKTTPASIAQGGGDPDQYKKEKAKKDPKAKKKKKSPSRRKVVGRGGGKHDKKGMPVNVSPNHPDYLKKKLYKRGVKPKGYGKEGESEEGLSTSKINRMGVRGQEKKIAAKKEKDERKAKAQRISNKLRLIRGLVPLMRGEKHDPNTDTIGRRDYS